MTKLDTTTCMLFSDTETGLRANCFFIIFSVKSGILETNKQILIFKFGEDLSYFVILRYKLGDFIKIYDDYVCKCPNIKGDFQKTLLLFHIGRKSFVENKWLWLHT